MKKKITLAAVSLVLLVAAALAVFTPRTRHIERATTSAARASVVLAELSDLQRWIAWMPRDQLDPRARRTFGGPSKGVGSSYYWSSENDQLGTGRMTVISASEQRVQIERELLKPRLATIDIVFTLAPEGSGTRVVASVTGHTDFTGKAIRPFSDAAAQLDHELDDALQQLAASADEQEKVEATRIERSATFAATPIEVQHQLSEVHRWASWSPWPSEDAKLHFSYGGHESGPGATWYWLGHDKRGQVTIISSSPQKVVAEVEVFLPRPSASDLMFTLTPEGAGTKVTLSSTGASEADVEKALTRLTEALAAGEVHVAHEAR
jgi:hypothetical protein